MFSKFRAAVVVLLALVILPLPQAEASEAGPQKVHVGVHLYNVENIDLQNNSYSFRFRMWLKWKGPVNPTENLAFVNLVDAWGLSMDPEYVKPQVLSDGYLYQRYMVEAKFYHKFWLGAFPLDWQKVTFELEDKIHGADELVYVPDVVSSALSEDLVIPGWEIAEVFNSESIVRYAGNFGAASDGDRLTSRYRFGLKIQRPAAFYLWKVIPPVLIILFCCFIVFLLDPSYVDARIGTPIAVLLTEVFLYLSFVSDLPNVGIMILLDHIFNLAYLITFLVLLSCAWTTRIYTDKEKLQAKLGDDEANTELQVRIDSMSARIKKIDRVSLIMFPVLLITGIVITTVFVRGISF